MIGIQISVSTYGWPAASKRTLAKAQKAVMEEVALRWHDEMLPQHFEKSAHRRYGYAKRSMAYRKRKNWKPDLVYSGTLQRALTSRATVRGAAGGVTLKMSAASRALNLAGKTQTYRTRRGGYVARDYPPIREEITSTTRAEDRDLARYARTRAAHHIEQINASKRS